MFANYSALISAFSSDALSDMITKIKAEFSRKFWNLRRPAESIIQSTTWTEGQALLTLPARYHKESQSYMFTQSVTDWIQKGSWTEQALRIEADMEERFAIEVEQYPMINLWIPVIREVLNLIDLAKIKGFDDATLHNLYGDIEARLMQYADELRSFYDDADDDSANMHTIIGAVQDHQWYFDTGFVTRSKPNIQFDQSNIDVINQLLVTLKDPTIPIELIKYVLNPTFGNSGTATIGYTSTPLFVSLIPTRYALFHAEDILNDWKAATDQQSIDPSDITEPFHTKCEREYFNALKDDDHARFKKSKIGRKTNESNQDHDQTFGFNFSNVPLGARTANRQSPGQSGSGTGGRRPPPQGGDQNPPPNQQQQPTIPDDDNYRPDPLLASLAIARTTKVQNAPENYASQDHMRRFNTTNETPTTISHGQMTRDDYFITKRDRNGTQMYMVTYTRKSHKPVFNVIT